jgi:hypothetical protein
MEKLHNAGCPVFSVLWRKRCKIMWWVTCRLNIPIFKRRCMMNIWHSFIDCLVLNVFSICQIKMNYSAASSGVS